MALFYFLSLYVQKVIGYSAITAGVFQLPLAGGIIAAAGLASPLVARYGTRRVLDAFLAAAGFVVLAAIAAATIGTRRNGDPGHPTNQIIG